MKALSAAFALASLLFGSSLSALPLERHATHPVIKPIEVAGITWMSSSRKATKIELAVANLGPNLPEVTLRLLAPDGSVVQTFGSEVDARRSAALPGFEIVRVKVNTGPVAVGRYRLDVEISDPATGRHDNSNSPVAVSWRGGLSTPPRQVLFQACSNGSALCGDETSSGVWVHDGANSYFAARPGSSGNPVSQ